MASGVYNAFLTDMFDGSINLSNGGDAIKVALLNNSHTFTATNAVWADVSANEISGTGYTAGGGTLDNQALTGTATVTWDADDEEWLTATFTAYHLVIYDTTNTNSLIASYDFGGAEQVTAGTFTIQWNASGIMSLTEV